MVGPWAYGRFAGRHVDRWLSSRAGWSADVLRGGTSSPRWEGTDQKSVEMGQVHISSTSLARWDCSTRSESGWQGRGTSRLTPRSRMLADVCTVAVRIIPSAPGRTLITLPKGHCIDGTLSSRIMTMVPLRILWLPLFHFSRLVNSVRYSRCQRLQKCYFSWLIRCQLVNRHDGVALKSRSRMLVRVSLIRRWSGVRTGRSFKSDEVGLSGRELRMASISITRVLRCSKVKSSVPTMRMRWHLNDFTATSHMPPKCGELGGLKRHCICRSARKVCILSWWSSDRRRLRSSFNSLLAPTKLVPLSERIVAKYPRRAMNRQRVARNASDVRSLTNSMWAALVARHTNMAT